MKKLFPIFLIALFVLVSPVFAQVEIQEDGSTVGGVGIRLNFTGDVDTSGLYSDKTINIGLENEVLQITSRTLKATDSPKRIICTQTVGDNLVILPEATAGLHFQIVDSGVSGTTRAKFVYIDSMTTDTIKYSESGTAFTAGDKLKSPGVTGDSITLYGATNIWYVIDTGSSAWSNAE